MRRVSARQYGLALLSLLEEVQAAQRPAVVRGFLSLLRRHHQLKLLPAIVAAAEQEQLHQTGTVSVKAVSARALPSGVSEQLSVALGQRVRLEQSTDRSLVAGVKLTVAETLIDFTLPTLLQQLRRQLSNK